MVSAIETLVMASSEKECLIPRAMLQEDMANFARGSRSAALEPDNPVIKQEKKEYGVDMTTRTQDSVEMLCSSTSDILIFERELNNGPLNSLIRIVHYFVQSTRAAYSLAILGQSLLTWHTCPPHASWSRSCIKVCRGAASPHRCALQRIRIYKSRSGPLEYGTPGFGSMWSSNSE